MPVPCVAIVGRPNVGKSSLFNWLAGRRIAIIDPTAGVTRDRLMSTVDIGDRVVEIVDTGGIGIVDSDDLSEHVERQIQLAIDKADCILHVVDGRTGLMPLDREVADRLRATGKPVLAVVNKLDSPELDAEAPEFHGLGHPRLVCTSAMHNRGKAELFKFIAANCPMGMDDQPEEPVLKLAIVGRRNTGKSTFINQLAEEERTIVSEVAGTTRDSVDVRFEREGKVYLAIDTAGVRRKKSLQNDLEFYGLARAERSIRRADVVLLFLDASQPISKVDKQLCEYVREQHKTAVFVANKWDLVKPRHTSDFTREVRETFPTLAHVPISFITAKSGKNVQVLLNLAQNLHKKASLRIGTGDLNRIVRAALVANPPPLRMNRRAKIFYATQASTNPPTIVLFTNGPELFDNTYVRYLEKLFRDQLPFGETALRIELRKKAQTGGEGVEDRPAPARARAKPARKKAKDAAPEAWDDV
ncbi:MAG: ribosome biogenesis GTPase Der [Gemmataceae bacterium]|nr:ribosome biogenesis GTPase Der [Gemmataceae bacterium]